MKCKKCDRFKFRVWDKEHKTYYCLPYGSYALAENGELFWKLGDADCSELDEEDYIVEQCTGLKDKNGNLIYESDYVSDGTNTYKVFWNEGKISLANILNNDILSIEDIGSLIEVIGNEHEERNFREV